MSPLVKLGLAGLVIGIVATAAVVARQRYHQRQEAMVSDGEAVSESSSGTNANMAATKPADSAGESAEPNDQTKPERLARVKYSTANQIEALAVNVVNDFEAAYNQHKGPTVRSLFTKEVATDSLPADLWEQERPFPTVFKFQQLETRADSSVLVDIEETVFDPKSSATSRRQRRLELLPADPGEYVIGRYSQLEDESPLSGFTN